MLYGSPIAVATPLNRNESNAPLAEVSASMFGALSNNDKKLNFSLPTINEAGARDFLSRKKWPVGLQDTFIRNLSKIPIRYFICDDSGSMIASDGHRVELDARGQPKILTCSRWSELTDALKFHAQIAHAASAPTEFRLLNSSVPISIGTDDGSNSLNVLLSTFEGSPNGGTPLCRHIKDVVSKISLIEHQLRANNQRACVMIATDGESSDGDIAEALKPLERLPVWVVVRLCTDDDKIVDYWNNIDKVLELDMDVLDDLFGEADEVHENNPWLAYGEPMHRMREFGIPVKEIDLLDEALLSLDQIRVLCTIIYGGHPERYPNPQMDWVGFMASIKRENTLCPMVWSPHHKALRPWIDPHKVASLHHKGGYCVVS